MYNLRGSSKYKCDIRRIQKQGLPVERLTEIIKKLAAGESLPARNKDHLLSGNYLGYRECHITPDWLLIYKRYPDINLIVLARTGSHKELF